MPTFPSNTNNKPKNLGIPYPPIILRRNARRTPGHRARHNSPRIPPRRGAHNPLRRDWRKGARNPRRDTGHTTRHHPKPTPTSTNIPTTAHPEKCAGKARGWVGGEGRALGRQGRGDGDTPVALLPLQPQKTNQSGQQIQHLIGIGHRPENHHPKSFKRQRPPTPFFGRSLDRRHRHRLNPPHEPPTAVIRPLRTLRTGNLQNPLKLLTSTKHIGYLH